MDNHLLNFVLLNHVLVWACESKCIREIYNIFWLDKVIDIEENISFLSQSGSIRTAIVFVICKGLKYLHQVFFSLTKTLFFENFVLFFALLILVWKFHVANAVVRIEFGVGVQNFWLWALLISLGKDHNARILFVQ